MNWGIGDLLDTYCPFCHDDFSVGYTLLAQRYPDDRMALLSSLQDQIIRGYLLKSPSGFQTDLLDLASTVLDPLPHFHYFYVQGQTHTMLFDPGSFQADDGIAFFDWLAQLIADDPAWSSRKP